MSLQALCAVAAKAGNVELRILKMDNGQFMAFITPSKEIAKEYPQLASPLQIVASAEAMDAEVAKAIEQYVPVLSDAMSNIAEVTAQIQAAKEAARQKTVKPKGIAPATPAVVQKPPNAGTPARPPSVPNDLFNAPAVTHILGDQLDVIDEEEEGLGVSA
jgi:PRTRC genetic system protein E